MHVVKTRATLLARRLHREPLLAAPRKRPILCTNLRGGRRVEEFEAETGIPIYDTVSIGVWDALHRAGIETTRGGRWGSLFAGM